VSITEEGIERQVKVLIKKFGYFLSVSQQGFSADITQSLAVGYFFTKKQKEQRQKPLGAEKLVSTQIWKL
jgi:hypothetical protein